MALGTFVAGRYTSTYTAPGDSARSLGIMRDGYYISWALIRELMDKTDAYGRGAIEGFYQGVNVSISAIAKEWLLGVLTASAPFNGFTVVSGADSFEYGTVGKQDTDNAGILVLTSTAGTPAAASPTTLTATYAIQDDQQVQHLYGPEHRSTPLNFRVYPYSSSGIKLFTTT